MKTTKRLNAKINKIVNQIADLLTDLNFQALPEENKRDFYKAKDQMKTFTNNLPR